MKPANIAAVFLARFPSIGVIIIGRAENNRTMAGAICGNLDLPRVMRAVDVAEHPRLAPGSSAPLATVVRAVPGVTAPEVIRTRRPIRSNSIPPTDWLPLAAGSSVFSKEAFQTAKLQLDRHQQAILGPSRAHPHKACPREHLARQAFACKPIEISQTSSIQLIGPGKPDRCTLITAGDRVFNQRRRLDPIAPPGFRAKPRKHLRHKPFVTTQNSRDRAQDGGPPRRQLVDISKAVCQPARRRCDIAPFQFAHERSFGRPVPGGEKPSKPAHALQPLLVITRTMAD